MYNRLTFGTEVQIADATVMYNRYHHSTILTVNYLDQITVSNIPFKFAPYFVELKPIFIH